MISDKRRKQKREWTNKKRKRLKEQDICIQCKGSFKSEIHIEKCINPTKNFRKNLSSKNICYVCKNTFDSPNHKEKCRKEIREKHRKLSSEGICILCSSEFSSSIHKNKCLLNNKERKQKLVENGKCRNHVNRETAFDTTFCEECWFRGCSRRATGSEVNWVSVKALLESQDYKCIYTGEPIIPGINASIDHLIPKSRGGPLTLENIQWTTIKTNLFKYNLTALELLSLAKFNYNKFKDFTGPLDFGSNLLIKIFKYHFDNILTNSFLKEKAEKVVRLKNQPTKTKKKYFKLNWNFQNCLKSAAKTHLGSRAHYTLLENLFNLQNQKCAYTGVILLFGTRIMSLDHKIPLSRNGNFDLENLHWVTFEINMIKKCLTHDEFLFICEQTWKRCINDPTLYVFTVDRLLAETWAVRKINLEPHKL